MKKYIYENNVFTFEGAISVEISESWVSPWRIDCNRLDFYPFLNEVVAKNACGVRVCFNSNCEMLKINFAQLIVEINVDVLINYKEILQFTVTPQQPFILMKTLDKCDKSFEIWLSQSAQVKIESIEINDDAQISKNVDNRKKWVHYGSSISHSIRASSPLNTWPSIVSNKLNLHLTNLGFGGNCIVEPMVAKMISELECDYISLKLGINCIDGKLSNRSFIANCIGFINIIREKHKSTPILIISPIFCAENDRETNICASGYTLPKMREELYEMVNTFKKYGDENIYYLNGLEVFDETQLYLMPDGIHPDAKAQSIFAENFINKAMVDIFNI